jgi:transcriptional regulator with XRE-family HTH domain
MKEKNISGVGGRIAEERQRLGKTQDEIADLCGVTRRTIGNIEREENAAGGTLLACLAKTGFDIQYVLTGVRSLNLYRVAEEEPPKYRPEPTKKQVDPEVLQGVIAGVKEYLNETGRELSPAKEAELVMLLLDFMNAENVQNKSQVREAVAKVIEFKYKRR